MTRPVTERLAFLDNARFWVMLMVVAVHSLTALRVSYDQAVGIYTWLLIFVMPAFILISGYTARSYVGDARQIRRAVTTLLIPYLIVETALQLLMRHYMDRPEHLMLLSPQWVGWFIIALFVWRLSTPIWRTLKYPITISILIALLIGLVEVPNVLALPKVLALLPFYVIGLHLTAERLAILKRTWVRVASAITVVATLTICMTYTDHWTTQWLAWNRRYDETPLDAAPMEGIWQRAQLIALSLVLAFAILSLIPWRRMWTTTLGERTVYCYLLHGFVILILREQYGLFESLEGRSSLVVYAVITGAFVLGTMLMTKPIAWVFRPIFDPQLPWLFRKERKPKTKPADESAVGADESLVAR